MKPVRLPVMGHDLLAVERFRDDTRHMIEFLVLSDRFREPRNTYIRMFLSDEEYCDALKLQKRKEIRIYKHFDVIEGHILPNKPKKKRRK